MSIWSRLGVPALASLGIVTGISSYWGYGIWKSEYRSKSDLWEDHVEQEHGELTQVAPGLFQVQAAYYTMAKYRNMTVLQLPGGGLLLHSPIALPETAMAKLEEKGKPQFLFIPSESVSARVDATVYKKRYPEAKIITTEALKDAISPHVTVDAIAETELKAIDPGFLFITPPLKTQKDSIIDAPLSNGQRALLAGELLWNIKFFPGLLGKLFVIMKLAGDGLQPQVSSVIHAFGFPDVKVRNQFWNDFSHYADGVLPGTENSLEPVPRYAALTMQHGNPVTLEVHRKILKVSKSEMTPL